MLCLVYVESTWPKELLRKELEKKIERQIYTEILMDEKRVAKITATSV